MEYSVHTISKLSDEDLKQLVAELMKTIKASRRKVLKLLKKNDELMTAWLGNLSLVGAQKDLPEETRRVAEEKKEKFELALVSNPEAFVTYQIMSFTIKLLEEVRTERTKRLDAKRAKKKSVRTNNVPVIVEAHSVSTVSQVWTQQPSTVCTSGSQPSCFSTCDACDA